MGCPRPKRLCGPGAAYETWGDLIRALWHGEKGRTWAEIESLTVRKLETLLSGEFDEYGRPKPSRPSGGPESAVVFDPFASFKEHCRLNGVFDERTVRKLYARREAEQAASEHRPTATG